MHDFRLIMICNSTSFQSLHLCVTPAGGYTLQIGWVFCIWRRWRVNLTSLHSKPWPNIRWPLSTQWCHFFRRNEFHFSISKFIWRSGINLIYHIAVTEVQLHSFPFLHAITTMPWVLELSLPTFIMIRYELCSWVEFINDSKSEIGDQDKWKKIYILWLGFGHPLPYSWHPAQYHSCGTTYVNTCIQ